MSQHLRITLTSDQHDHLTHLIRSGKSGARVQTRGRILLLSDRGPCQTERRTQRQIAAALHISLPTVRAICQRFAAEGLDSALTEKPRPGQKPKITGEVEAQLVLLACSDPPEGRARWTMQLLADTLIALHLVESITDSAVCERLKKNALKPWLVKRYCIGKPSAQYVAKMEDVLSVYERPFDASRAPSSARTKGAKSCGRHHAVR